MISKSSGMGPTRISRTMAMHTGIVLDRTIRGFLAFPAGAPGTCEGGIVERTGDVANRGCAHGKR